MESRDHVAFLAGSTNRVRILETLCDEPRRQCELVRVCDLSRSTVHRTLDGLGAHEWVRNDAGEYRLTAGGALVLEQYVALETAIEHVDEWGSVLSRLGDVAATLPPAALDDATLVATSSENPHAALSHFADAFGVADIETFRGISPVVSPVLNEAAAELLERGADMELVIDDSVLDASEVSYPDALDDAHTARNFALYLSPDDLAFGLGIFDDRVLVGAYDDRGVMRECLDGTTEALSTWANAVYEDRREAAQRLDVATQFG